jgi:hypothetical protein
MIAIATLAEHSRLVRALEGTRFAPFAGMITTDVVERIVQVLEIQCTDCLKLSGVHHVTSEKNDDEARGG